MLAPFRIPAVAVLVSLILGLSLSSANAVSPTHLWSKSFGAAAGDGTNSVVVDASGNVVMTGVFSGTVNFGGSNLVSGGGSDVFLVKYNASGVHVWSQVFGGTGPDQGMCVALDYSGNILLTGSFSNSVNFGGGALVSAGGTDIFLAKYSPNGTHQWSRRFGNTSDDVGRSVAANSVEDMYVTGSFQGSIDFGGGTLTSAGLTDVFLLKYSATGAHMISNAYGGTGADIGYGVAADPGDYAIMTGSFSNSVDFGTGALVSPGGTDVFMARYEGVLNIPDWSRRYGSVGDDGGLAIDADGSGNLVMTGYFWLGVSFGGSTLISAGGSDVFLAKYNSSGTHLWSQRFGNTSLDVGHGVAFASDGRVAVTGSVIGAVDFGGGAHTSAGATDIFAAQFDVGGAYHWSLVAGSALDDIGFGVAMDGWYHALVGGSLQNTVDLGGGGLTSAGSTDGFLVSYVTEPVAAAIDNIVDIPNDQGREVRIEFTRAGKDDPLSPTPVLQYEAYRRIDPALSASVVAGTGALAGASFRELLATGWTQVGEVSAHAENDYSMIVPTIGDSTIALGQYHSTFYVRAATAVPSVYFDSAPDSGYSLDNLSPAVPQNLVYTAGDLTWDESTAADFDYFTVYGSNTSSFGAATLIDYAVAPSLDVTSSPYFYYFVTATDFSGNESKPAKMNATLGVGGTPASYVLSVSSYPNPFNPSTTVSYTVPLRGAVTVAIYDARGVHVATLVSNEDHTAGAYTVRWDGRADSGVRVSSGVYFARIEQNGSTRSKKITLLK